jgi:uncharacterized SAM-dependent methyltransferase
MREHIFGLIDANNFYVSCERVFQPALAAMRIRQNSPYLFIMLGYTFGNLDGREIKFFTRIKQLMKKGDYFLFDYIAIDEG